MTEPAIVTYGRGFINDYPPREFHDSLCRAFKENRADFIILDSNPQGQKFLATSVAWAIHEGLLYCDEIDSGEQQEVSSFRLTKKGKIRLEIST